MKVKGAPKIFSHAMSIIHGIIYTDLTAEIQWSMAQRVLENFYTLPLESPHKENFHTFLDYLQNTWLRKESSHFLEKNSNFSKEILTEQTRTLTNNCSESLHSALRYFMHRGHITKVNFLNFLKNFLYKN